MQICILEFSFKKYIYHKNIFRNNLATKLGFYPNFKLDLLNPKEVITRIKMTLHNKLKRYGVIGNKEIDQKFKTHKHI